MITITCDICGGTLSMDASGEFATCDSCGMKHTKDRVKAKAQANIGTVAVSNIASLESLMKRGHLALEDSEWKQADEYFDRVLDINPEYASAYMGKLCAEAKVKREELLVDSEVRISKLNSFIKAIRFAITDSQVKLKEYDEKNKELLQVKEKRQKEAKEETKRKLAQIREHIAKYKRCIAACYGRTVGVRTDGTVVVAGNMKTLMIGVDVTSIYMQSIRKQAESQGIDSWENIASVYTSSGIIVGLGISGYVYVAGKDYADRWENRRWSDWLNIVDIALTSSSVIGLNQEGKLCGLFSKDEYKKNDILKISDKDLISITFDGSDIFGLKNDGTIIHSGYHGIIKLTDIVEIAGNYALKTDGTVHKIVRGLRDSDYGPMECGIFNGHDIVAISVDGGHIVGLKADGTVVAQGRNDYDECDTSNWCDIVAIAAGGTHTVGLKADGTVVAVGDNKEGQCNVHSWRDIEPFSKEKLLEKQRRYEQKCAEDNRKKTEEHYQELLKIKTRLLTEEQCQNLAKQFREMNGYKDATELSVECEARGREIKQLLEEKERSKRYIKLVCAMEQALTEKAYQDVAEQLRKMNGYRNTAELVATCEEKCQVIIQDKAKKNKAKKRLHLIILGIVLCGIIGGVILLSLR